MQRDHAQCPDGLLQRREAAQAIASSGDLVRIPITTVSFRFSDSMIVLNRTVLQGGGQYTFCTVTDTGTVASTVRGVTRHCVDVLWVGSS